MKKFLRIFAVMMLAVVIVTCFFACSEKKEEGITLHFVTGFDDIVIEDIVLKNGIDAYMPEPPIEVGYNFLGWYYDEARTQVFSIKDGFAADTTLYARWEKKSVTINGQEGLPSDVNDEKGFCYRETQDGGYAIVKYSGEDREINVFATYNGKNITAIADGAFFGNTKVESIVLSEKLCDIGLDAFGGCTALCSISVSDNNDVFKSVNGVLYSKDGKTIVAVGQAFGAKSFTVPKTVENIGAYAFSGCAYDVVIPADGNLHVIGNYAFSKYAGKVTLTACVTELRKYAFYDTAAEVTFDNACGVTKIENGAFDTYLGEKLILNGNISEISECAFNNSSVLLDLSATGLTTLGDRAFFGYKGLLLTVPYSVNLIGSSCFCKCISTVVFEENSAYMTVTENAFNQFAGEVTFPSCLRKVEKNAFYAARPTAKIHFSNAKEDLEIVKGAFDLSKAVVTYKER